MQILIGLQAYATTTAAGPTLDAQLDVIEFCSNWPDEQ